MIISKNYSQAKNSMCTRKGEANTARLSQRSNMAYSLCSNSKKEANSHIQSVVSNNTLSHKNLEMKGESNTLDISPEEFTITELNIPEVEDTLVRNSSMGINSINHTTASRRNCKAKPVAVKLNKYPIDKVFLFSYNYFRRENSSA